MALTINGAMLKSMVRCGAALLQAQAETVDALNVFPVPDGDTGANMSMTMQSARREVEALAGDNMADVANAMSRGALKGARGNSGVILSQMLRGFASVAGTCQELTPRDLAACFKNASDMAYKALMKPREGTILTVGRIIGEQAQAYSVRGEDNIALMRSVLDSGEAILQKTPDMLPVLKAAGVVDAGGRGLLFILHGFLQAMTGQAPLLPEDPPRLEAVADTPILFEDPDSIEFGYCSEVTVCRLTPETAQADSLRLRDALGSFADSVVVVCDGDIIKVHAHSNEPYRVLKQAMDLGEITDIKIDNMREQNRELARRQAENNKPTKALSVVAVAAGEGLQQLFSDLMVDTVVTGGQTMNPSIEDLSRAIMASGGEEVLVLPNNPNIILAATQAAELITDRAVVVVPTRSMTAGVAAMLAFAPETPAAQNAENMVEAIAQVRDGQVTYAVRDTTMGELTVKKDDIIGLCDGKLVESGASVETVVQALTARMVTDQSELITLYYGADTAAEAAAALRDTLSDLYPHCDVEVVPGGQPLYYYFISVE